MLNRGENPTVNVADKIAVSDDTAPPKVEAVDPLIVTVELQSRSLVSTRGTATAPWSSPQLN